LPATLAVAFGLLAVSALGATGVKSSIDVYGYGDHVGDAVVVYGQVFADKPICVAKRKVKAITQEGDVLDIGTTSVEGSWTIRATQAEFNAGAPTTFKATKRRIERPGGDVVCDAARISVFL
jgi:hypothetical protein